MQSDESSEILAAGRFLRLVRRGTWEYAERVHPRPAVVIVAVTSAGELVLVEQFRVPLQARVIELPAGLPHAVRAALPSRWLLTMMRPG